MAITPARSYGASTCCGASPDDAVYRIGAAPDRVSPARISRTSGRVDSKNIVRHLTAAPDNG